MKILQKIFRISIASCIILFLSGCASMKPYVAPTLRVAGAVAEELMFEKTRVKCERCNGEGVLRGYGWLKTCPSCKGRGYTIVTSYRHWK